jgi:hypothetical protein
MAYTPEVIESLRTLRRFTGPNGGTFLQGTVVQAINTLDDAGVFHEIDEQTDYALVDTERPSRLGARGADRV